jgi:hypothetical protein
MEKPDKYYLDVEKKILGKDKKIVLETIIELRKTGKPSIIPLLFTAISDNIQNEISEEIFKLLGLLKDKEGISYVIDGIKSKNSEPYKAKLITTCWQSGLDYSAYIEDFTEQFIKGDFQIALEAFTVIEEWIHSSLPESIKKSKEILIDSVSSINEEKKPLYIELVKLLESNM